jgi:1-acyl-sn-glycerol-3-phosphate acyltransferase
VAEKRPLSITQRVFRWLLSLLGWRVIDQLPDEPKYILAGAFHTSNWDFPIAILSGPALGVRWHWIGKHTLFRPPFGWLMKLLGGIAVDRRKKGDFVQQMIATFNAADSLKVIIAPEGTRAKAEYWRTGFYYIALGANIPIALGFLDYRRKEVGVGMSFRPSGDIEKDVKVLQDFFKDKQGLRPHNQGEIHLRPRLQEKHDDP